MDDEQTPLEGEVEDTPQEGLKLSIGFKTSIITGQLSGISVSVGPSEAVFSPQEAESIGMALIKASMNVLVVDQMRQQAAIQQLQAKAVPGSPLIRP